MVQIRLSRDLEESARAAARTPMTVDELLARFPERDTDRDFFMTAAQAKEYRIVDEVISSWPTTRTDREGAVTAGRADVLILPQEPARRAKLIAGLTVYDSV